MKPQVLPIKQKNFIQIGVVYLKQGTSKVCIALCRGTAAAFFGL